MRFLSLGDLHLKPSGVSPSYEQLELPAGTDGIVSVGDVIHRAGKEDIETGRRLFAKLQELEIPVWAVSGNHDPYEYYPRLIEGFSHVNVLHEEQDSIDEVSLVGVGCEQFDIRPEIRCRDFQNLDPREAADRRYAADANAQLLEDSLFKYTRDEDWVQLQSRLGIQDEERSKFRLQLDEFEESFEIYNRILSQVDRSTIVLTHAPPFNTSLDRHHSIGEREMDLDGLHMGLLGLKIALRKHRPAVALSGHSHQREYDVLADEDPVVHMLNLGFRGVGRVEYDLSTDAFSYTWIN